MAEGRPGGGAATESPTLAQGARGWVRDIVSLLQVRLELLGVEAREHALDLVELLVYGLAALLFLGLGLGFLAALITVLLWETHRSLALGLFTAMFLTLGGVAAVVARQRAVASRRWFEASVRELAKDAARLDSP